MSGDACNSRKAACPCSASGYTQNTPRHISKAAGALAAPAAPPNPFLLRGEDSRGLYHRTALMAMLILTIAARPSNPLLTSVTPPEESGRGHAGTRRAARPKARRLRGMTYRRRSPLPLKWSLPHLTFSFRQMLKGCDGQITSTESMAE